MPSRSPAVWSPVRRAAFLATAATLGVLAGFGVREGRPMTVLGGAGLRLRGIPEFVTPDRGVGPTAILGALHAGVVSYAWGLLAAWVAWRLGGWRGVLAVAALAAAIVLVDARLPALLQLAAGAPSPGQRVLGVAALAVAAVLGTHLAAPRTRALSDIGASDTRAADRVLIAAPEAFARRADDRDAAHDDAREDARDDVPDTGTHPRAEGRPRAAGVGCAPRGAASAPRSGGVSGPGSRDVRGAHHVHLVTCGTERDDLPRLRARRA